MNSEKLSRTTFVLNRETAEQLGYVSRRMGVSRSALVRDVLEEPVAMMAKWVSSVPADMTPADVERLTSQMSLDLDGLIGGKLRELGHE